jgi:hypothetical protein
LRSSGWSNEHSNLFAVHSRRGLYCNDRCRRQSGSTAIPLFALPAGLGDVAVGLVAAAIGISTIGRFAFDRPNELISVFPLVLIPTFLVPLAILLHIVSLMQLGRATAHAGGGRETIIGQMLG